MTPTAGDNRMNALLADRRTERRIAKLHAVPLAVRSGDTIDHPQAAMYTTALRAAGARPVQAMHADWLSLDAERRANAQQAADAQQ